MDDYGDYLLRAVFFDNEGLPAGRRYGSKYVCDRFSESRLA